MKRNLKWVAVCAVSFVMAANIAQAQTAPSKPSLLNGQNPWKESQLMQPAALNELLTSPKVRKPVIFNIGFVNDIKDARHVGAARDTANLLKFRKALSGLPKGTPIVVYCGCCPFEKCPNIRPAFALAKQLGFRNAKLLNLSTNIKTDWIDKGYAMPSSAQ